MQTLAQLRKGALKGAVSLKLSEGLTHFPPELFDLADTLEVLDLSQNKLSALPADLGRFTKLRILFCSDNLFTELPAVLGDCPMLDIVGFKANKIASVPASSLNPNIRWLILTSNRITTLPPQIGHCSRMQKLMLAGNLLSTLPAELSNCRDLALLRIAANRLTELPGWLLSMSRLSWLAFSGNRFSDRTDHSDLHGISWEQLHIRQVLGEGASGIIFKGVYSNGPEQKEVAVKVFKGSVTSDGLPEDEMNAFIAAGTHSGMVKLLAQVTGHPEGKKGVVMELIPERFYNLGLPPTFTSCTRDVFTGCSKIPIAQAVKIAATIASVACQLHSKGIMHGDLYAHNILVDDAGNTLFGDLGAASFYDRSDMHTAPQLERLEVSAFGCLLDDLLSLCTEMNTHPSVIKLKTLRDAAMGADIPSRPGFQHLHDELIRL